MNTAICSRVSEVLKNAANRDLVSIAQTLSIGYRVLLEPKVCIYRTDIVVTEEVRAD